MRKYGVRTSPADYSAESNEEISFLPQETRQVELILKPLIRDISKHIQVSQLFVCQFHINNMFIVVIL